ncbi:uncharacterized protein LOC129591316 [Paramacrobiotus metropolitanus]|uniref:uncharacterized protein LOC129591316 n=1 Tax=Paramacrobiotus metropolitanus TaxID=2943436 RepID=UPI00244581B7|nr:uncharacterized protein LOC129591316 [Paramacrobiotus metropolitanus]
MGSLCRNLIVLCILTSMTIRRSSAVNPANYFPAPTGLDAEVLNNHSIRVFWRPREYYRASSSYRITLYPEYADYRITKDVPGTSASAVFEHLMPAAVYNVTIQSGHNDYFGKKGEVVTVKLEKPDKIDSAGRNVTTPDGLSWLEMSASTTPKTEEIVIVSLIVVFWIFVICVFTSKWAKIRVIEPRYFDYKFLLKYDKAFAIRNQAISVGGANGPRKSIAPSMTGIRITAARHSIAVPSMRMYNAGRGSVMCGSAAADSYSNLDLSMLQPSRPFLLPLRLQQHRHSHDVRMEFHPPQQHDNDCSETPTSV